MRQSSTGHPLVYHYQHPRIGDYYQVAIRRQDRVIHKHFSFGEARTQEAALRQALKWRDEQMKLNPIMDRRGRPRGVGLPIGVRVAVTQTDPFTGAPIGYGFRVSCKKDGRNTQREFRMGLKGQIPLSWYRVVRKEVLAFFRLTDDARRAGYNIDIDQLAEIIRRLLQNHPLNPQRGAGKGTSLSMAEIHAKRIVEAERLLRTTKLDIKEIAQQLGYGAASSFRVWWWKKHPGLNPGDYRRNPSLW